MKIMAHEALRMAGVTIEDIDFFDLYSCFPSAVIYMAEALGLDLSQFISNHNTHNKKKLTVIGGLPYHGILSLFLSLSPHQLTTTPRWAG